MKCEEFWKHYEEFGITKENETHLLDCAKCRKEFEAEQVLLKAVDSFPEYQAPETLWDSISEELTETKAVTVAKRTFTETIAAYVHDLISKFQVVPFKPVFGALVIMIVSILATQYYYTRPLTPVEKFAQENKIARDLEETEQEYLAAIDKLSKLTEDKKETMDPELYDVYQEKLALLDEYIQQCKDAIDENEYNINARTYFAMALKEKADTLQEMYDSVN